MAYQSWSVIGLPATDWFGSHWLAYNPVVDNHCEPLISQPNQSFLGFPIIQPLFTIVNRPLLISQLKWLPSLTIKPPRKSFIRGAGWPAKATPTPGEGGAAACLWQSRAGLERTTACTRQIYLQISVSIYLSIYLFIYLSFYLCDIWQNKIFMSSCRLNMCGFDEFKHNWSVWPTLLP